MEREQIVKMVDEVVESLLEGGPGSGRYPAGSGKNPDAEKDGKIKDVYADQKKRGVPGWEFKDKKTGKTKKFLQYGKTTVDMTDK